ncbi:uL15m family ribosomal protein [Patescibacteria group bacterium]
MSNLSRLTKIKTNSQKRKGRGYGSGKGGHTVGRGAKGAKARGKVGLLFEGTKRGKSLIGRLPFRRGKGKFKSLKPKVQIVNIDSLNVFPPKRIVDLKALKEVGFVRAQAFLNEVKVLGKGTLIVPLVVKVPCSPSARKKIVQAGGKVEQETLEDAKSKGKVE